MTITSLSHLAPDEVARHTFASVRRGFDPTEVRDYLESVAAGLRALADREQELRDALAEAEERAANPVIDDAMLAAGLSAQAIARESDRIANLEADLRERAAFNRRLKAQRFLQQRNLEISEFEQEQARLKFEAERKRVEDALQKADEARRAAEAEAAAAAVPKSPPSPVEAPPPPPPPAPADPAANGLY